MHMGQIFLRPEGGKIVLDWGGVKNFTRRVGGGSGFLGVFYWGRGSVPHYISSAV